MNILHSSIRQKKEPLRKERFFFAERGNVLFYVFLAMGLMAALTYAFVKDSRENYAAQSSVRIAEELFSQINLIRSAVQQCAMEFPEGGVGTDGTYSYADLNHDDVIDSTNDNPNIPYPLNPSSPLNPNALAGIAAAADDKVENLTCVGAPAAQANIFQGTSNQGRFLPPPPTGFSDWTYSNSALGVYIRTTAASDPASMNALNRVDNKFEDCQADINYLGCGAGCLTVWIIRATCP